MKGKNFMIFGLGAAGGFIGGSAFMLVKVFESERLSQTLAEILADKVCGMLFGDRPPSSLSSEKPSKSIVQKLL